jgi:hypothetical protein
MAIAYAKQKPAEEITAHYTPLLLARQLLSLVPYSTDDVVIDPAAGFTKPFYSNIVAHRMYCEVQEGTDFLNSEFSYDWAITNPPYHLLWKFIDKASLEARKGFAFLVNINGINTLTPRRLQIQTGPRRIGSKCLFNSSSTSRCVRGLVLVSWFARKRMSASAAATFAAAAEF